MVKICFYCPNEGVERTIRYYKLSLMFNFIFQHNIKACDCHFHIKMNKVINSFHLTNFFRFNHLTGPTPAAYTQRFVLIKWEVICFHSKAGKRLSQ